MIELATSPAMKRDKAKKERRSSLAMKQNFAINQNNLLGGKQYVPDKGDAVANVPKQTPTKFPASNEVPANQEIQINGRVLQLNDKPNEVDNDDGKRWNKFERSKLSVRDRETFMTKATSPFVLPKDNKLQPMTIKNDDEKLLFSVKNLQFQLDEIEKHCIKYDIDDVYTIVEPIDVMNSPEISTTTYNIFVDYATLHPSQVAVSNAWYRLWVKEPAIRENLSIGYDLFKNLTDGDLWMKSNTQYNDFAQIQQGAPLILFFILKRILDVSENSLKNLEKRFRTFKITKIKGENIEEVVTLLKSIHSVLLQCSTDEHTYVPQDFDETLLKIFQTSSVKTFNDIFDFELKQARHQADKNSARAVFPTAIQTYELALNTYNRLTGPGDDYQWCKAGRQNAILHYKVRGDPNDGPPCYNCGRHGCRPAICPDEPDDARIAENRAKAAAARKERSRGRGRPSNRESGKGSNNKNRRRDSKGRPLKKNKNNEDVVDTRVYLLEKANAVASEGITELKALAAKAAKKTKKSKSEKKQSAHNVSTSKATDSDDDDDEDSTSPEDVHLKANDLHSQFANVTKNAFLSAIKQE